MKDNKTTHEVIPNCFVLKATKKKGLQNQKPYMEIKLTNDNHVSVIRNSLK